MGFFNLKDIRGRYQQLGEQSPTRPWQPDSSKESRARNIKIALWVTAVLMALVVLYNIVDVETVSNIAHGVLWKQKWISQTMKVSVDDPVNMTALTEACNKFQWREGLTFRCVPVAGGIGNVRNKVLTCLRFAMEAGAGYIIPDIMTRSSSDLAVLTTNKTEEFDYMFDSAHFTSEMRTFCPQMPIYNNWTHYNASTPSYRAFEIDPADFGNNRSTWNAFQISRSETWVADFDTFLATLPEPIASNNPVLFEIGQPLFQWPMQIETRAFQSAMGHLISFNTEARNIAGLILYKLSQLLVEAGAPNATNLKDINPRGFLGVHLRTAKDAKDNHWRTYEDQTTAYTKEALARNASLIFVSSGEPHDIIRFRNESAPLGLDVVSKDTLLIGKDLKALESLSWDQMALVDYEVLLRSAYFMGIDTSTFALNIAMTRRGNAKSGVEPWEMGQGTKTTEDAAIQDDLNWVIGSRTGSFFMTNGMWP